MDEYYKDSFNSLFEMPARPAARVAERVAEGFNSLFEMRRRPLHGAGGVRRGVVSILYLRCMLRSAAARIGTAIRCFNSLFEMRLAGAQATRRQGGGFQFSI